MPARLLLLAAVVLTAAPAAAQPTVEPVGGKLPVTLTLYPAVPLKPLSRLTLLPEYRDMVQGNAVQGFLRAFMEQDTLYAGVAQNKRAEVAQLPLTHPDVLAGDLSGYVERHVADAARMTTADWQLFHLIRQDGYGTLLPDVQKMRALATVLQVTARSQIAAGKPADAARTVQILFALARTLEAHPTLIGHLVGVAIGTIGCNVLEELVQTPGCPNLFWALADLPTPFLSLRLPAQGERIMFGTYFGLLAGPAPLSEAELTRAIGKIEVGLAVIREGRVGTEESAADLARVRYALWSVDPGRVAAARDRLARSGVAPALARDMLPLQAVVADDCRRAETAFDDFTKWQNLPAHQAMPAMRAAKKALPDPAADGVLVMYSPLSLIKVKSAQARLDQRLAYLQVVEALRLDAAEGTGVTPPESLAELKLPVPLDPVTGKPFVYSVTDRVATLTGGDPSGEPGNGVTNRVYTIRMIGGRR